VPNALPRPILGLAGSEVYAVERVSTANAWRNVGSLKHESPPDPTLYAYSLSWNQTGVASRGVSKFERWCRERWLIENTSHVEDAMRR
jgi:hypothetical protein